MEIRNNNAFGFDRNEPETSEDNIRSTVVSDKNYERKKNNEHRDFFDNFDRYGISKNLSFVFSPFMKFYRDIMLFFYFYFQLFFILYLLINNLLFFNCTHMRINIAI
jgi:hypothetical protein